MKKRILSLFLAVLMCMSMFSFTASAAAEEVTVQYGGSMNDANAAELLGKVNVDGGLIGGASLKTDKFTAIVKAANA